MSDDPTTVLVDVDELENRDGIGVGDDVINVDDLLGSLKTCFRTYRIKIYVKNIT